MEEEGKDLTPLLDMILEIVPPASDPSLSEKPLQAQVFNLAYDNFLGRMGICRIYAGTIKKGDNIIAKDTKGTLLKGKVAELFTFEGFEKKKVAQAGNGDIVMVAGLPDIFIGHTLMHTPDTEPLPAIHVDEPTLSLHMVVNDSPFTGQSGKFLTSRQLRERLEKELEINVGLQIDFESEEGFKILGRGELHLAVLLEHMRREGFEMAVSQPQTIIKEIDGVKSEPFEEVTILVPDEYLGAVMEKIGNRKGIMKDMKTEQGHTRCVFHVPTRGLIGYRNAFVIDTKGEGILTSIFHAFAPYAGTITKTEYGSMVSMTNGKALAFALGGLQERGVLYITPGTEVYEGMVVGYTSKGEDMTVNPTKGKQLTNMRASSSDEAIKLTPPFDLTLEKALGMMRDDEYLEITPTDVRLRKKYLTEHERKKHVRQQKKED